MIPTRVKFTDRKKKDMGSFEMEIKLQAHSERSQVRQSQTFLAIFNKRYQEY